MRRGRLGQNRPGWNAALAGPGLPRLWLLSDTRRLPDPRPVAASLPPGSAVLARDLDPALLPSLAALARRRRLVLMVAGDGRAALAHGAGLHLPDRRPAKGLLPLLLARRSGRRVLLSVAAHGRAGLARARRLGADLVLLSPVFPTASHPGAPALGPLRWAALARRAGRPVIALGGVTPKSSRRLPPVAWGWAAIGALMGGGGHPQELLPRGHSVSRMSRFAPLRDGRPQSA
ncbi:thiamine phosphate synthase [Muricoccus roseus]|uniref:thiamine phosphate synthase n=1 Tax=Muricoccus roseus TaxID=198092 RepID=UPI0009338BD5|nr:thiamine phosphate synthase [Roseomonas rosea]